MRITLGLATSFRPTPGVEYRPFSRSALTHARVASSSTVDRSSFSSVGERTLDRVEHLLHSAWAWNDYELLQLVGRAQVSKQDRVQAGAVDRFEPAQVEDDPFCTVLESLAERFGESSRLERQLTTQLDYVLVAKAAVADPQVAGRQATAFDCCAARAESSGAAESAGCRVAIAIEGTFSQNRSANS